MNLPKAIIRDLVDRRLELRRLLLWAFSLATILVIMGSVTPYLRNAMAGKPGAVAQFWEDLLWMSIWTYAWLVIVPVIYVLAFKVTEEPRSSASVLRAYLGGFAFAYVVHVGIQIAAMLLPAFRDIHPNMLDAVIHHMLSGVFLLTITYGVVAVSCHSIASYRRSKDAQMRRMRLESELIQARMDALRSQLQPHFLFNALNSVSSLMYRDVHAADEMLAGIGELLRVLIKESDRHLISLREELDFVEMYLKVEKIRHGQRLKVSVDVDPSLHDVLVPALVLQPIVENAIKHAASQVTGTAVIRIAAKAEGERLKLSVSDNGPGFVSGDGQPGSGVGMSNLRARLEQLYGTEEALSVKSAPEGATVKVVIPIRSGSVHFEEETSPS